jgi:hypothetical protein
MTTQTHITLETITPDKAHEYLQSIRLNRKIRQRHLEQLTTEVVLERWLLNGETIKFDINGHLIDGQHRLWACIKAEKAITTYVIRALTSEALQTIDTGLKRSPGDILGLQGYSNATNLAASARWIWRYEQKQMEYYAVNPSIDILRNTIEVHVEMKNSLAYGTLLSRFITRSLGSALHCLMSEKNSAMAEEFFTKLKDGDNLTRQSPLYQLRQRLISNSQSKAKLPDFEIAALTIKAFNLLREGKTTRFLRWGSTGSSKEPFPTII